MRYQNEVTIQRPLDQVWLLFDDPENLRHWQPTLKSFELMEGVMGQVGAKSRLVYHEGKRVIQMTETILTREANRFSAQYETGGFVNLTDNQFETLANGDTRWVQKNEFRFGVMMSVLAFFMQGEFPKQSQKFMDDFKAFAERA